MDLQILLLDAARGTYPEVGSQLVRCGYLVRVSASAGEAATWLARDRHAAIVVSADCDTPPSLCHALRAQTDAPIMTVLQDCDEDRTIAWLDAGADSVLEAPVSRRQLAARMQVLTSRQWGRGNGQPAEPIRCGALVIDPAAYVATLDGEPLSLTPTEFRLLTALARRGGKVARHADLIREVWGADGVESADNLRLYVSYLRRKLGDDPGRPRLLLSRRGVGYRIATNAMQDGRRSWNGPGQATAVGGTGPRPRGRLRPRFALAPRDR